MALPLLTILSQKLSSCAVLGAALSKLRTPHPGARKKVGVGIGSPFSGDRVLRQFPRPPGWAPWERENFARQSAEPMPLGTFQSQRTRLPLPSGEGWGEGNLALSITLDLDPEIAPAPV